MPHFGLGDGKGKVLLEFLLGPAGRKGCLAVQKFVDEDAKSPDVGFRSVDVVDEPLGRHVDRRADVNILEFFPESKKTYLVNLAKPKSAILA